jgi:hypothetical protein
LYGGADTMVEYVVAIAIFTPRVKPFRQNAHRTLGNNMIWKVFYYLKSAFDQTQGLSYGNNYLERIEAFSPIEIADEYSHV